MKRTVISIILLITCFACITVSFANEKPQKMVWNGDWEIVEWETYRVIFKITEDIYLSWEDPGTKSQCQTYKSNVDMLGILKRESKSCTWCINDYTTFTIPDKYLLIYKNKPIKNILINATAQGHCIDPDDVNLYAFTDKDEKIRVR